ncbi:MAG TPA: aldo/keto reductase [Phycisphaerae bacterium]|nr:aldo/keto reductase [Phycisphaerae bacterium]
MEHRKLGESDLELPVVTFGAWAIGGLFWGGSDDKDAIRAMQTAFDLGIDAIDTAPIYGCGHSETLVGQALKGRRDTIKILTKCGLRWDDKAGESFFTIKAPGGANVSVYKNVKAASIQHECEQSLRRLGVETIDLYQVHWLSASATAEETMGMLVRLKEQGKIRQIGVCNYDARQLSDAVRFAPVVSDQIKYNLLERDIETDPLPYCRKHNMGILCYSPMAMGLLSGHVTMNRQFPATDVRSTEPWFQPANRRRVLAALEKIQPVADAHQATLAQLSVAWVLARQPVTTALVGARTPEQVKENAGAARIKLSEDELSTVRRAFEELKVPG